MSKRKMLFHGTDKKSKRQITKYGIELHVNRGNQDFGDGFYLTPNKGVAKERGDGSLLAYEIDLEGLNVKIHKGWSQDWKNEIFEQRVHGNDVSSEFDCVIGPIADGEIKRLVKLYRKREISKEQFQESITKGKIAEQKQFAIKSQKGISHLTRKPEEER